MHSTIIVLCMHTYMHCISKYISIGTKLMTCKDVILEARNIARLAKGKKMLFIYQVWSVIRTIVCINKLLIN